MVHYSEKDWADFVRGLLSAELASEMQAHLNLGCGSCRAIAATLRAVEQTAARDRQFAVPPAVTQRALGVFRRLEPAPWKDLPRQVAQLLFDSLQQPALAGTRAESSVARHLAHEAAPYRVDLRLEQAGRSAPVAVTGQLSATSSSASIEGLEVYCVSADRTVHSAFTSEFGEFQFDEVPKGTWTLFVAVDGGKRLLEIPVDSASR